MQWFLMIVTALHGLIHTMGFFNETGVKKFDGFSGDTLIRLASGPRHILGFVWLVAALLMVVVAVGIAARTSWWKPLAIATLVVSQALIIIWWPDAKMGTIPNIILLLAVIFWEQ